MVLSGRMDAENAPGTRRSDPDLLDALRKQARHLVAGGQDPWALLIV